MNRNKKINDILKDYSKQCIDFDVYIIAEAQMYTVTKSDKRIMHANESEFFSRTEIAEIASAIFNVFGFAKVFYDEASFIEYIIHNKVHPNECIVYNLSRNGKKQGKKSLIPAFCDLYGIRYTGSDAFVISLLRNKLMYSNILANYGINVPLMKAFHYNQTSKDEIISIFEDKEIIIKNNNESASLGLMPECKMKLTIESYEQLCKIAKKVNSRQVLIQEYIKGKEYEVLVLQHKGKFYALSPIEIVLPQNHEFLDSNISNCYNYQFKKATNIETEILCKTAEKASEILGIKDYARFDFRIRDGIPYLFDIAGTPYTIRHSSVAYLFETLKYNYEDVYKAVVTCMLSNYQEYEVYCKSDNINPL